MRWRNVRPFSFLFFFCHFLPFFVVVTFNVQNNTSPNVISKPTRIIKDVRLTRVAVVVVVILAVVVNFKIVSLTVFSMIVHCEIRSKRNKTILKKKYLNY
jgi:hypothetical protein